MKAGGVGGGEHSHRLCLGENGLMNFFFFNLKCVLEFMKR